MYHEFLVNQTITNDCKVKVHFVREDFLNWTYETVLGPNGSTNTPIFPIVLDNKDTVIHAKTKGRETSCRRISSEDICFMDDYSVPGGFLICVTGPPGYEPKIVKLKNKPTIADNDFNRVIPTHFEVKSNKITNQASVLMHVLERVYFGIRIEFTKVDGKISSFNDNWFNSPFDLTLSLVNKQLYIVDKTEISKLHPNLDEQAVSEFTKLINELIEEINKNSEGYSHEFIPSSLKDRISKIFPIVLGTTSSIVTLVDSYKNAGVLGELLTSLVKLFG